MNRKIGSQLSLFGHLVILVLIQVGGLGILTISTLILMMMIRPADPLRASHHQGYLYLRRGQADRRIRAAGHLPDRHFHRGHRCLLPDLRTGPQAGWEAAAYPAVFHSIRAFCNAGFALYADSFIGCREDWIVNGVLAALIIVGGIGFVVIADVKGCLFNKSRTPRSLSLHSSLALTASAILVLAGTVAILCMEWKNTLAPLSIPGRLPAALFQSITARTAGINTLNMVQATSVVMISAAVITLAIMVLMTSELGGLSHTQTRGRFLELFFETISAFGTVGLSAGVTGSLSTVGPITIFVFRLVRGFGKLGADRTNMGLPVRESPRSYGPRHAGNVHGPGTAKGAGQAVRPCRLRGPENTEGILVPG